MWSGKVGIVCHRGDDLPACLKLVRDSLSQVQFDSCHRCSLKVVDRFGLGETTLCLRLLRMDKIIHVRVRTDMFAAKQGSFRQKQGSFWTKAKKFSAKFNVFRLKLFMLEPRRDVNDSLQVETGSKHNSLAFGPDLRKRDHVTLVGKLASFGKKLLSIRRILVSLTTIRSNFVRNFLAQTRSRQTLLKLPCSDVIKL